MVVVIVPAKPVHPMEVLGYYVSLSEGLSTLSKREPAAVRMEAAGTSGLAANEQLFGEPPAPGRKLVAGL